MEAEKKKLKIYIPGIKFPSVSLTGSYCFLNCAHCGRHYLEGMKKPKKRELVDFCLNVERSGGLGCLLSGGMDSRLKVPIDRYADELREIKRRTNLKLNAHVGFIDESDLEWLKYVDVVSLDFVSDDDVIRRVYKIYKTAKDYLRIIELLTENGIRVAPHITIGLDFGRIHWEYRAVDLLLEYPIDVLVFDVLIPTKGTEMENLPKPSIEESIDVIEYARKRFDGEISVGCMRPTGRWRIDFDRKAVLAGIDRLTNPPKKVIEWAKKIRDVEIIYECCVM